MSLSKSEEEERFQEEAAQGKKRIILSTIHSAKGLEWSHVHLIGAGSRQLPHPRTQGRPDEEKEEQRLVYVACTRARDRFVVTHPRRVRGLNGKYEDQSASPLIPAEFVRKLT
jgi:DNA helicase-2/ATP-dependent DNA helicase PcrA